MSAEHKSNPLGKSSRQTSRNLLTCPREKNLYGNDKVESYINLQLPQKGLDIRTMMLLNGTG